MNPTVSPIWGDHVRCTGSPVGTGNGRKLLLKVIFYECKEVREEKKKEEIGKMLMKKNILAVKESEGD